MSQSREAAPLSILFVSSMYPSTGFPQRGVIVHRLADALRAMGHRVELLALGESGGPWRYLLARRRVRAAVRATRPQVIHAHFGYSGLAVPSLSAPLVSSFYGDDLNGTVSHSGRLTWKSRFGIAVSQYVAWRSSRCIVVSAFLQTRLWTAGLRAKTSVVRDAVDPHLFRPLPRDAARARLGVPQEDSLIIFPHAAGVATKRLWLAEAAVARVRECVPSARLWVVNGRPPDEMPWYYAAADAMIVTSLLEGGPSSVKEALACGLPVVSVPVGDTQLFAESPRGMIRATAEPSALASALVQVLERTSGARQSYLPDGLSLAEAAMAIVDVYRKAVAARPT